jgi:hypothetical protein
MRVSAVALATIIGLGQRARATAVSCAYLPINQKLGPRTFGCQLRPAPWTPLKGDCEHAYGLAEHA